MKIIIIAILIGIILLGIIYKLGKNSTYYRPCGGGRHNA